MNKVTERKLAKEIVIFFSSVLIICLLWAIFWAFNYQKKIISKDLREQITQLTIEIDSINWSFANSEDTLTILYKNDSVDVAVKDIGSMIKHLPETKTEIRDLNEKANSLAIPPPHDSWATYQKFQTDIEKLNLKLALNETKIYTSKDLINIAKWISILTLCLVYPIRFLYILLKWSIKTLT